ncbi:MAG: hypothetical protein H7Y03_08225 [Chitinophagaceae bacterium]|nr:hypothetical protein [Chitinophagaceae bacterium]
MPFINHQISQVLQHRMVTIAPFKRSKQTYPGFSFIHRKETVHLSPAIVRELCKRATGPRLGLIDGNEYNGHPGDPILVVAIDDHRVKRLNVQIFNSSYRLVEEGFAAYRAKLRGWMYTASKANEGDTGCMIRATAYDIKGNEDMIEVIL